MSNLIKIAILAVGSLLVLFIAREVVVIVTRPPEKAPPMPQIRVSTADLPQGLLLREDDLKWKSVPADQVPPNAIVAGPAAPDVKGALLRHPVSADAVISTGDVILPNAPGFLAATLKPGMLAVSVAVDDVSGNAGLIEPGDYVDLILTQQAPEPGALNSKNFVSETVLQHVRVLAAGSEIGRPKTADSAASNDSRRRARTVTLEVTPRMSELVSVAGRLGSLSLALRSFAVTNRDPMSKTPTLGGVAPVDPAPDALPAPVWSRDVTRVFSAPSPAPVRAGQPHVSAPPRPVAIYRGSSRDAVDTSSTSMPAGPGAAPLPPGVGTPQ